MPNLVGLPFLYLSVWGACQASWNWMIPLIWSQSCTCWAHCNCFFHLFLSVSRRGYPFKESSEQLKFRRFLHCLQLLWRAHLSTGIKYLSRHIGTILMLGGRNFQVGGIQKCLRDFQCLHFRRLSTSCLRFLVRLEFQSLHKSSLFRSVRFCRFRPDINKARKLLS